jgi:MFS family permease
MQIATATREADPIESMRMNRSFRLLLAGSSVSMLGSRVTIMAYPMLVLYLTGSPVAAGWAAFAATAPSILVYMPAGALVDRLDPRCIMLWGELGRGLAMAGIVTMIALRRPSVPLLIAAGIFGTTLEVFSTLAERRYVGSLVAETHAPSAMARIEARAHLVVTAGRPLGGLLFELAPIFPFLFDSLTFVVSVCTLLCIKSSRTDDHTPPASSVTARERFARAVSCQARTSDLHIGSDIREGIRWLLVNKFARSAGVLGAGATLISQALILVFIAEAHMLRLSTIVVGMVLAMSGLGGMAGSAVASRISGPATFSWLQVQMLAWSVALIMLTMSGGRSPIFTAATLAVFGLTGALGNIEVNLYLVRNLPKNMLARVTSINRLISFTAAAIGPVIGGFLLQVYGIRDTVNWLMIAAILLAAYAIISPSMRTRRRVAEPWRHESEASSYAAS